MDSGKNVYSRGRGRGGGGNYQNQGQGRGRGVGRGRGGNHSGFTDQQQRTTRPPVRGNFRGFQPPVQQAQSCRQQQSVQGQSYGPKQEGAGPSSGRGGVWSGRPRGSTPLPPSFPPQRAQSTPDNLEIQAPKISEQPASPPESVENRIVPTRRPDRGWTLAVLSILRFWQKQSENAFLS